MSDLKPITRRTVPAISAAEREAARWPLAFGAVLLLAGSGGYFFLAPHLAMPPVGRTIGDLNSRPVPMPARAPLPIGDEPPLPAQTAPPRPAVAVAQPLPAAPAARPLPPVTKPATPPVVARAVAVPAPVEKTPPPDEPARELEPSPPLLQPEVLPPMARLEPVAAFVEPRPLVRVQPGYPEVAHAANQEGLVMVDAYVREDGSIGEVRVANSSGHAELDRAAVEAMRRWQFDPAREGSRPVGTWRKVPFRFSLR